VDVGVLKDAANVRLVRRAAAELSERGFLVPEGLKEGIRELCSIEWSFSQLRNGLFDLNGVHSIPYSLGHT
jgi:hypothetical protein